MTEQPLSYDGTVWDAEDATDIIKSACKEAHAELSSRGKEYTIEELNRLAFKKIDLDEVILDDNLIGGLVRASVKQQNKRDDNRLRKLANDLKKDMDSREEIPHSFEGVIPTSSGTRVLLRDATIEHLNYWLREKQDHAKKAIQIEGDVFNAIEELKPFMARGYTVAQAYAAWRFINTVH